MKIIISAIITTKDGYVNARLDIVNAKIELCCLMHNWNLMDNTNIYKRGFVEGHSLLEWQWGRCFHGDNYLHAVLRVVIKQFF